MRKHRNRDDEAQIKKCARCGEWFPFTEYLPKSGQNQHLRSFCRPCTSLKSLEHVERNREAYNARKRGRPKKLVDPAYVRDRAVRRHARRMGVDPDELAARDADPATACEICGQTAQEAHPSKHLAIDHDHKTGKFRGLICHQCNTALGLMEDNPARLRAAADYLERSQE